MGTDDETFFLGEVSGLNRDNVAGLVDVLVGVEKDNKLYRLTMMASSDESKSDMVLDDVVDGGVGLWVSFEVRKR